MWIGRKVSYLEGKSPGPGKWYQDGESTLGYRITIGDVERDYVKIIDCGMPTFGICRGSGDTRAN